MVSEVRKRSCYSEQDIPTFWTLNQLLSGHSILNRHRDKIDKNVSIHGRPVRRWRMSNIFVPVCKIQFREGYVGMESESHSVKGRLQ